MLGFLFNRTWAGQIELGPDGQGHIEDSWSEPELVARCIGYLGSHRLLNRDLPRFLNSVRTVGDRNRLAALVAVPDEILRARLGKSWRTSRRCGRSS